MLNIHTFLLFMNCIKLFGGMEKGHLSLTNKLCTIICLSGKSRGLLLKDNLSNGKQSPGPQGTRVGWVIWALAGGVLVSAVADSLSE